MSQLTDFAVRQIQELAKKLGHNIDGLTAQLSIREEALIDAMRQVEFLRKRNEALERQVAELAAQL